MIGSRSEQRKIRGSAPADRASSHYHNGPGFPCFLPEVSHASRFAVVDQRYLARRYFGRLLFAGDGRRALEEAARSRLRSARSRRGGGSPAALGGGDRQAGSARRGGNRSGKRDPVDRQQ